MQEPADTSKQPIRTYLGHVTGYQPIRDQYFLVRSVHGYNVQQDGALPISVDHAIKTTRNTHSLCYYNYVGHIITTQPL